MRVKFYLFLACILLTPLQVYAQSGPTPSYISSMSDYQVRAMSGSYAPQNGTSSMRSITPQEWLDSDPSVGGLRGVIGAWCGGGKSLDSNLYVHGGGHNDGANNGLYIFDYSGTTRPEGWVTPLDISAVSAIVENAAEYSDGRPTSIHTYDGIVHTSHNNHIYRFSGAHYAFAGGFTRAAFKYNVQQKQWTRLPDTLGGGGAVTIYDPASGNIFVTDSGSFSGYFFRTANDTWSSEKTFSNTLVPTFYSNGVWDTNRRRGFILGAERNLLMELDFTAETATASEITATGDTEILDEYGISAVYDPVDDVIWMFGGNSDDPTWDSMYRMNADGPPWVVTKFPLTGETIQQQNHQGNYSRFNLMAQWRAIGIIASVDSPAYVIKLPAASGPNSATPAAPTNLRPK